MILVDPNRAIQLSYCPVGSQETNSTCAQATIRVSGRATKAKRLTCHQEIEDDQQG
jgi:hypothetical protein